MFYLFASIYFLILIQRGKEGGDSKIHITKLDLFKENELNWSRKKI